MMTNTVRLLAASLTLIVVANFARSAEPRLSDFVSKPIASATAATESVGPPPAADQQAADCLTEKVAELKRLQGEIDELYRQLGKVTQVQVEIKLVEFDVTGMRNLGLDIPALEGGSLLRDGNQPASLTLALDDSEKLDGFITAVSRKNLARTIASPTLVARLAQSCRFRQGGEVTVPTSEADGAEPFETGIQVDFTATSLGGNRIALQLKTHFAEVDDSREVVIKGVRKPALRERKVDTGLEVQSGQTFMFAGMTEHKSTNHAADGGQATVEVQETLTLYLVKATLLDANLGATAAGHTNCAPKEESQVLPLTR